ncbi:MAG TPA: S9 family peptidase [Conexibacter sp.]|nr:S9 family peptidase [Conexibacter sp.]
METLELEQHALGLRTPAELDLSPDARRLAFTELVLDLELDGLRRTVRVLDVATGDPVATFGEPAGDGARWSPSGDQLALCARDERGGVRVLGSDGSDERLLENVEALQLAWRPDGGALAVVAVEPERRGPRDPVVVRDAPHRFDGRGLPQRRHRLYLVELDGAVTPLTDDFASDAGHPAFSVDGRLAFVAGIHMHMPAHVHLIEDGRPPRRVTPIDSESEQVGWTPDGAALLVVGKRGTSSCVQSSLFHVDPESGEMVELAAELDRPVADEAYPWIGGTPAVTADGDVLFVIVDEARGPLMRVPLAGGAAERVIAGETLMVRSLSLRGDCLATILGDWRSPAEIFVSDARGEQRRQLTHHNAEVLADVVVKPEDRRFRAPDGLEVQGFLLRGASGPDPAPLLLYIHGGPHGYNTPVPMDLEFLSYAFVRRGWNVLLMNPRASGGWGAAHYGGVSEGWGVKDGEDFLCAVDALIAEGVADPGRLAVTGYSYGGYMTNWLVGHTDRFKAAVSGAGVSEMVQMYGTSGASALMVSELGGLPSERWELYDRCSPLRYAGSITTPTLFLHPQSDQQVPPGQAETMFTLLRQRGVETELVLYPDAAHEFILSGSVAQRFDYWRRLVAWITDRVPN